jgi:hypothetical protein
MTYQGRIGQQLRPIRTRAGILGVTHKIEKYVAETLVMPSLD